MTGLNDLFLEALRAAVLAALLLYLFKRGHRSKFGTMPGARMIFAGFVLLLCATLLDITDEIPGLERYVIIGATQAEAYIETICGYLLAFILLFIGFVRMIPSLNRLEEVSQQLSESEEKFRSVFDLIPDVVAITRLNDGQVVDLNRAFEELTGIPRDRLLGRTSLDIELWCDPADRERMIRGAVEQGMIHNLEARFNTADGRICDTLVSARRLMLHGEAHVLSVYRDITNLKDAARALEESEEKFHTIFKTIPDVVSITRLRDGMVVDVNPAIHVVTGIPREQYIGSTTIAMNIWGNPERREHLTRELAEQGEVRNMEVQLNIAGRSLDCLLSARVMALRGEQYILAAIRDVSEQKAIQRALMESETRFRAIFDASPDPLIIARIDGGGIVEVNRAFIVETEISRDEALGRTSAELNIWDDPAQRDDFMGLVRRDGHLFNYEARFRRKSGEARTCLASAQVVTLNESLCLLLACRDINLEKQAELALQAADRMKSEFISMAAHELRTPLTTILGYAELLRDDGEFGNFSQQKRAMFIEEIYDKGEALAGIVNDMLDISRIESGHPLILDLKPHDMEALLAKVVERAGLLNTRHNFRVDLPAPQSSVVVFDLHRMTQVFENLLSNAIKYSPDGGTVTVRGGLVGDDYVVTVIDQGIGMTPEQQARIFDKFYRADASNTAIGGLGLGMSIARQIVESHGGRIWVESDPGAGTQVSFSLPCK